jgi:hypothetical protein
MFQLGNFISKNELQADKIEKGHQPQTQREALQGRKSYAEGHETGDGEKRALKVIFDSFSFSGLSDLPRLTNKMFCAKMRGLQ